MTKQNYLDIIIPKVQESCPELTQLIPGCEVMVSWGGIGVGFNEPMKATVVLCKKDDRGIRIHVSSGDSIKSFGPSSLIILGHPVQLHHVLWAMDNLNAISITSYGEFIDDRKNDFSRMTGQVYDLSKPLRDQSVETLAFIAGVLE